MVEFIKICGIRSLRDLHLVERFADATGVVINSPSHRRISLNTAKDIIENSTIPVFLVSTMENVKDWERAIEFTDATHIQIHGDMSPGDIQHLKEEYGVFVMKVFIAPQMSQEPERDAEKMMMKMARCPVDRFLLDTGAGTGLVHDLRVSRFIGRKFPVVIAGGLTPENVRDIVRFVRPYGVDVSSGVESEGAKDSALIEKFVKVVRDE